jgi:hypothetical protein
MAADFKIHFLERGSVKPFPFVAVPQTACPKWGDACVKAAQRARGAFGVIDVGGTSALVLTGNAATAVVVHDGSAWFVRWPSYKYGDNDARVNRMIASVKDAQWVARGQFEVQGNPVLLFSAAPSPYKWGRWEMPDNFNAGAAVVPLAVGRYDVHVAEHVTGERTSMDFVRLTPAGKTASAPKAPPLDPARAKLAREAAKVRFIDSEGGPFVALPPSLRKAWHGAKDFDSGTSDYGRACAIEGAGGALIGIGDGHGVVVAGPESATAFEIDGAWLFVTQHDARDPVAAYEAARTVPEKSWKRVKGTLTIPSGGLELRDASAIGRTPTLKVPVRSGTYEVARAVVKKPGIFLSLLRLRRVRASR